LCELWWLSRVQQIFGGTTEIIKEIIGRSLGL
jgi:alkylation response protein AidB-like acyl-CoA dehydrogenase